MDTKAINQLRKKVLDLLAFVFVALLFCYVLVPFVGDVRDITDLRNRTEPLEGYFSSVVSTASCFIGGLGVRLIIGLAGEPEASLGSEPVKTSDVSRLDKGSLIGPQSRRAGFTLSLLGFIWGVYVGCRDLTITTAFSGSKLACVVCFYVSCLLMLSYIYSSVKEGALFRRGAGLFYLLFQLPEYEMSSLSPGLLALTLLVWVAAIFGQEISLEVEVFSATRPLYRSERPREGEARPGGAKKVPSISLPFRVLPFGFSPLVLLFGGAGVTRYLQQLDLLSLTSLGLLLGFLLGFASYFAGGVEGARSWSPSNLSDRLSSMGYYLPGRSPGEATERYFERLKLRLATVSGILMALFFVSFLFLVALFAPEGHFEESSVVVLRLLFEFYCFADVADRTLSYFETGKANETQN